jgi:Rod binding domain-containing protein
MAAVTDLKAASSVKSAYAALAVQKELAGAKSQNPTHAKARQAAEDFEAVYLNAMFNQMFTAIDGEGPFGGEKTVGVWRSFLTDEYAKSFAKKGGIGIASEVYRTLIAQQESRSDAVRAISETQP